VLIAGSTSLAAILAPVARDPSHQGLIFSHDMLFGIRREAGQSESDTVAWSLTGSGPVYKTVKVPLDRMVAEKCTSSHARELKSSD
jgi:hypothetical protein